MDCLRSSNTSIEGTLNGVTLGWKKDLLQRDQTFDSVDKKSTK